MSIQYWRMQLHPNHSTFSSFYAHTSIAKGFIGLDFKQESNAGDLLTLQDDDKLGYQKSYLPFARDMKIGDIVVFAHKGTCNPQNYCVVAGVYNDYDKVDVIDQDMKMHEDVNVRVLILVRERDTSHG